MKFLKNIFKSFKDSLSKKRNIFFAGISSIAQPPDKGPQLGDKLPPLEKKTIKERIKNINEEYKTHKKTFRSFIEKSGKTNQKLIEKLSNTFKNVDFLLNRIKQIPEERKQLPISVNEDLMRQLDIAEYSLGRLKKLLETAMQMIEKKDSLGSNYAPVLNAFSGVLTLNKSLQTKNTKVAPQVKKFARQLEKAAMKLTQDNEDSTKQMGIIEKIATDATRTVEEHSKEMGTEKTSYKTERPKKAAEKGKLGNVEYYIIGKKVKLVLKIADIDRSFSLSLEQFEAFKKSKNPEKRFCEILCVKNKGNGSFADIYKYFPRTLSAKAIKKSNDELIKIAYSPIEVKKKQAKILEESQENYLREEAARKGVLKILNEKDTSEIIAKSSKEEPQEGVLSGPAIKKTEAGPKIATTTPEPAPKKEAPVPPKEEIGRYPEAGNLYIAKKAPEGPKVTAQPIPEQAPTVVSSKKKELVKEIAMAALDNPQFVDSMVDAMLGDKAVTQEVLNVLKQDPNFVEGIVAIAKEDQNYDKVTTGDKWKVFKELSHGGRFNALFRKRKDAIKRVLKEAMNKPELMDKLVQLGAKYDMIDDVVKNLNPNQVESVIGIIKNNQKLMQMVISKVPDIINNNPKLAAKIIDLIPKEKQMEYAKQLLQTNPTMGEKLIGSILDNPELRDKLFQNKKFVAKMTEIALQNPEIKNKVKQTVLTQQFGALGGFAGGFSDLLKGVPGVGGQVAQMEKQMMNDPKIQAMALESIKKDTALQKEIFDSLSPEEKSQILEMAFNDRSFQNLREQAVNQILKDPKMMPVIISALPPQVLNEIARDILA